MLAIFIKESSLLNSFHGDLLHGICGRVKSQLSTILLEWVILRSRALFIARNLMRVREGCEHTFGENCSSQGQSGSWACRGWVEQMNSVSSLQAEDTVISQEQR